MQFERSKACNYSARVFLPILFEVCAGIIWKYVCHQVYHCNHEIVESKYPPGCDIFFESVGDILRVHGCLTGELGTCHCGNWLSFAKNFLLLEEGEP